MAELGIDDFEGWNLACPKFGHGAHHPKPPNSGSVFLFTNVTNPLPWPESKSAWSWFEDTREMVGYFLNVVLLDCASIWFQGHEGQVHLSRTTLDYLFGVCDDADAEDAAFFLQLEDDLLALAREREYPQYERTLSILKRFTDRFGRGAGYHFDATPYPDLSTAYAVCLERTKFRYPAEQAATIALETGHALAKVDVDSESAELLAEMFCIDIE